MQYQSILFCTDYSDDAESAFVHAMDQAVKYNARLHFINVIPAVNPCRIHLDKTLSEADSLKASREHDERHRLEEFGALKKVYEKKCQGLVETRFVVKIGSPDVQIIQYADENDVDLIILGTAGRHERQRLVFTKTAANVSKFANCQVITIGSPNSG
ncbi:MAG: universal stress protein [Thermodesulfobacteriota bacterium]|nr:universal stress protein [Thermodesulfobacteriota bacterium]